MELASDEPGASGDYGISSGGDLGFDAAGEGVPAGGYAAANYYHFRV